MSNVIKFKKPLSYLLVLFTFVFWQCPAKAQVREEVTALEKAYEEKAILALEPIMKPNEYSVIIGIEIDRDEDRLNDLEKEIEKNNLPGMPGAIGGFETMSVSNKLFGLKSKANVHVVLAPLISKEKEEMVRSLLKMKLHLDEAAGDTLVVTRSTFPVEKEEEQASKLPELSWKMWVLIFIIGLMALAGVLIFISRKQEKGEKFKERLEREIPAESKPAPTETTEQLLAELVDPSEVLYEQKQQILSLATQYQGATIVALTEHFQKGNEKDLLHLCEAFGWENSKKLFADLSPRIWGKLGFLLLNRSESPTITELSKSLEICHKIVLKKFLEQGSNDPKSNFDFIWKLSSTDRRRLLTGEAAGSIALICLFANDQQIQDLMEALPAEMQEAVTMSLARLEVIPDEMLRSATESLLKKLKFIKSNPETKANGPELAAALLRSLPAEKEAHFYAKMKQDNPNQAQVVRQTILLYEDVVLVPHSALVELPGVVDGNILVMAMRSGFPEVKEHILNALPPKRAQMIIRDLELTAVVSEKQVAAAQREVVKATAAILKSQGIELSSLVASSEQVGAA